MKKILLFFLLGAQFSIAQNIKITEIRQVTKSKDGEFAWGQFIPNSNQLLVSKPNFEGLYLIDLKSKKIKILNSNLGSGYEPAISTDGSKIIYRKDIFEGLKKYSELFEHNLATKKSKQIENKSRNLNIIRFNGNELEYSVAGQKKSKVYEELSKSAKTDICVQLEDLKPVIYKKGIGKKLLPNGDGNYIWVSMSADQTKIVYNYNGKGTFVCDLNGKILNELGKFHAPKWLTDDLLVGMNDVDDGKAVTSSDIIAYSLKTGKITKITNTLDQIEMYPNISPSGDYITYHTSKGEIFIMKINIQ